MPRAPGKAGLADSPEAMDVLHLDGPQTDRRL